MADTGPHSQRCATAGADTECDCDCAGAQHAIVTTGGRPAASKVTDRAKAIARADGREVVEGGTAGTIRSRERTRQLPPPLADRIREIAASMPQTTDEWDALVPRTPVDKAGLQARLDEIAARRPAVERDISRVYTDAHNKERLRLAGLTRNFTWETQMKKADAAAERAIAGLRQEYLDLGSERYAITQQLRDADDGRGVIDWPKDPTSGRPMPTPEHHRRLNEVLEVGSQVLAHARGEADRDPEVAAARKRLDYHRQVTTSRDEAARQNREAFFAKEIDGDTFNRRADEILFQAKIALQIQGLEETYLPREDQAVIARRESQILRDLVAAARPFGGGQHSNVDLIKPGDPSAAIVGNGARADALDRLRTAERYYPDAWVEASSERKLALSSSDRAYYQDVGGVVAMPKPDNDKVGYAGAFDDYTDEVNVHELGHRMEMTVPGLTALEFTMVRRRSTTEGGGLEPTTKLKDISRSGYRDDEVTFKDRWRNAYAGKTYEGRNALRPDGSPWELFQVGMQDTFGRGRDRFDDSDELQAFVLGALLTLGHRR